MATVLLDMQGSYVTVFCRREFRVDAPDGLEAAWMRVSYDDGVVIFLNGAEVGCLNMPAGAVSPRLLALGAVEPAIATVPIPAGLLVEGRNILAVSVHNSAIDSSDLSFDPAVFQGQRAGTAGCGATFRRGDGDGDGRIDLTDAISTLTFLFLGGPAPGCADAADGGVLQLTDAVYTLNFLFLGGSPIPPPAGPGCGIDPTEDALDCGDPPACP